MEERVKLVNLTDRIVNVCGVAIPPSGVVARVQRSTRMIASTQVGGADIPLVVQVSVYENVPAPDGRTIYIVPPGVGPAAWAEGRKDVAELAAFDAELAAFGVDQRFAYALIVG